MLNCIVVDDQPRSIEALEKYILQLPVTTIAGTFEDPLKALEAVSQGAGVDILFLDIDMPELSGLELAHLTRDKAVKIIFTTAHAKYAFQAYEAAGDAYLLKPFTFSKFAETVYRLFPHATTEVVSGKEKDDYFFVKSKEDDLRIVKVSYRNVAAFESMNNYIKIYLNEGKALIAYLTISDILELVRDRNEFFQVHRAFIISTSHISQVDGNAVKLTNSLTIPIGENYKNAFLRFVSAKLLKTSRKK